MASSVAEDASERGASGILARLFPRFSRWWSRRQARRNQHVFFVTNYDAHEDGFIRDRLLAKSAGAYGEEGAAAEASSTPGAERQLLGADTGEKPREAFLPESPGGAFLQGIRSDNEIHTAKYSLLSFFPLVLFYQLTRFSNFYFICIAMLQLVPAISHSGGVPTYLIPISIIIGLSVVKEFFEDYGRHRSDEEENSKRVLVFEKGELVEKQWRHVRVGDVVKITAGEQFPADLVLLNCAHDFGICNVETKNVDGESNVKSRFCLPKLTRIFADDETAGKAKVRFLCEPVCDNLTSFTGKVILPALRNCESEEQAARGSRRRRRSSRGAGRESRDMTAVDRKESNTHKAAATSFHADDTSGGAGRRVAFNVVLPQRPSSASGGLGAEDDRRSSLEGPAAVAASGSADSSSAESADERPAQAVSFDGARVVDRGEDPSAEFRERNRVGKWKKEAKKWRSRSRKPEAPVDREEEEEEAALSFKQLLLRGTSMVETKWAYGAVVYAGKQTRLMMNGRVGSMQKWSRLELNYSSHVVVMILVQVLSVLLLSFMSIYWIETQGYRATYLDLRHYVSTLENFGITFGATFLVFASFVPIDLFMLWEICRFVQGLFINFDDQMKSAETGRHALSQASQLIEEMGNVTHVYSDKTGTLTKNLMQLKCVGLGHSFEYGMDKWCDERASMNVTDRAFQKQMRQLKADAHRRSMLSRRLSQAPPSPQLLQVPWGDLETPGSGLRTSFVPATPADSYTSMSLHAPWSASPVPPGWSQRARTEGASGDTWEAPETLERDVCVPVREESLAKSARGLETWPSHLRVPLASPEAGGRGDGVNSGSEAAAPSQPSASRARRARDSEGLGEAERVSPRDRLASAALDRGFLSEILYDPIFLREGTAFVDLDRVELARSILQAPPPVLDRARHLFLIMGICHTVLIREKKAEQKEAAKAPSPRGFMERITTTVLPRSEAPAAREEEARRGRGLSRGKTQLRTTSEQPRQKRQGSKLATLAAFSICSSAGSVDAETGTRRRSTLRHMRRSQSLSGVHPGDGRMVASYTEYSRLESDDDFTPSPRRTAWFDEASGFAFRDFEPEPPEYDASSPDELCLISACNYFGLEFAARPSLLDMELELTSSFMVELLLGWKREAEMRQQSSPGDAREARASAPNVAEPPTGTPASPSQASGSWRQRSPDFTEMTEQLIVKQLERAQRLIAGERHQAARAPAQGASPSFEFDVPDGQKSGQETSRPAMAGDAAEGAPGDRHDRKTGSHGAVGAPPTSAAPTEAWWREDGGAGGYGVGVSQGRRCVSHAAVPFLSFNILDVLEFDNDRKRMSVITRGFDGRHLLLCKGADTQMIAVAEPGQDDHLAAINAQLHGFACSGLRTLVFGYRYLPPGLYEDFHKKFTAAQQLLGDEQERAVADCIAMVEKDLRLVGCSGIEDKLQDDVQGTIKDLKTAGMKVWVLTGDKLETAINIGHSTNLITEAAYNAIIDAKSKAEILDQLSKHERHCRMANLLGYRGEDVRDSQWWAEIDWGDLGMNPDEDEEIKELLNEKARSKTSREELSPHLPAPPSSGKDKVPGEDPTPAATVVNVLTQPLPTGSLAGDVVHSAPGTQGQVSPAGEPTAPSDVGSQQNATAERARLLMKDPEVGTPRPWDASRASSRAGSAFLDWDRRRISPRGHSRRSRAKSPRAGMVRSPSAASSCPLAPAGSAPGADACVSSRASASQPLRPGGHRGRLQEREKQRNKVRVARSAGDAGEMIPESSPSAPPALRVGSRRKGRRRFTARSRLWNPAKRLAEDGGFRSHKSQVRDLEAFLEAESLASFTPGKPGMPEGLSNLSGFGTDVRFREYSEFCITVTGAALAEIMGDRLLKVKFYSLARHASTLIASRVTPKQKALLLRQNSAFNPRGTSLAIGDGANDVAMILAACVGVGIAGKEGLQAARSADFAIGEFRFLRNLLFVHGREALRRNCFLVYSCIFRNAVMCWCTLAMNHLCGFSGQDVWNQWTKQIVSLAFNCLPLLAFVTLDRQVPQKLLLENPVLYEITPSTFWPYYTSRRILEARTWINYLILDPVSRMGFALGRLLMCPFACCCDRLDFSVLNDWFQHRKKPENDRCYGTHCLLVWLAFAFWVAVVQLTFTIYSVVGAWTPYANLSHGFTSLQFDSFSHVVELAYVITTNGVVALMTNTWTVIGVIVHVGELVAALIFWVIISYWKVFLSVVGAEMLHGTFVLTSLCAPYYLGLTITIVACFLPLLLPMAWQMARQPTLEQVLLEQLRQGTYKPVEAKRGRRASGVAYVAVEAPQAEGEETRSGAGRDDEYKGFAFTHEPVFGVLPALQEAYKAIKKTGEGAKVLLRRTHTFIKGGEGTDMKK